jgi:TRAP-type C4-dicarboxylate transport system substrate-binding protein
MTNHIWSGFNFLAYRPLWLRLPDDIRAAIERNVGIYVRRQREEQGRLNAALRQTLAGRGLVFNDVDPAPFRARLAGVYATWKQRLGSKCWSLLEAARGPLG